MSYRTSKSFMTKPTLREVRFRRASYMRVKVRDDLIDCLYETIEGLEKLEASRLKMLRAFVEISPRNPEYGECHFCDSMEHKSSCPWRIANELLGDSKA